ncbi:hypothetical protein [Legionella birminghamensis]|nr:hypothetical protein [Legionella birminghamensis]
MSLTFRDYFFLLVGIAGAIITLYGFTQFNAQAYYVAGSSLLLITAIYSRLVFFIALELILIAGHGAILLGIGSILQFAIPVLLCIQLLTFFYLIGQLNNIYLLIGIVGIGSLSIGFAYANDWIFFIGGVSLAIYAFSIVKKNPLVLLWAILNSLFALIAIINVIFS